MKTLMAVREIVEVFGSLLPPMFIQISDKVYATPTESDAWSLLKDNYIEQYRYMTETFDCDDYALLLHAWVRQEQYRNKWEHPWALGEAWGYFGGEKHALNVVVTADNGLMLIEPQSDGMRKNDKKDIFTFVRM